MQWLLSIASVSLNTGGSGSIMEEKWKDITKGKIIKLCFEEEITVFKVKDW